MTRKTSLLDDIRARTVDIVLVHSLHNLSSVKSEVLTLYGEMRSVGVHLHEKGESDFESILQEDEHFTNFIYQFDPTRIPQFENAFLKINYCSL